MSEFTEYVCGFMIDPERRTVALVLKARPEWQRGRWNGVGGKIESGETPRQAMAREFAEEAGVGTFESDWRHCVTLTFAKGRVYFFCTFRTDQPVPDRPGGDEPVRWHRIQDLPLCGAIPNLCWLVPLCLDADLQFPIEIRDTCDAETNGATMREKRKGVAS